MMKSFFASFLGALTALAVFLAGGLMVCALMVAAIVAMSQKKPIEVQRGSYLVFDLSANIQDAPDQMGGLAELMDAFGGAAGGASRRLQLRTVTRALRAAAADPAIAGVYLTGNLVPLNYGSGYAALKEVREALEAVEAAGKPVKAFVRDATLRDYYVMSVASEVTMDPFGAVLMPGLASQPLFYAGALEKLGIGVQVTRVGKYKSAVEPFTRRDMSPENRAQTQKLLDDVWGELTRGIEQARKLPAGTLQRAVDSEGLLRAELARGYKLVDRVTYVDQVLDELKAKTGRKGSKESFKQIALSDYARRMPAEGAAVRRKTDGTVELPGQGGKLAIVYAEGEIIDGEGDGDVVGGSKFARELRRLRLDPTVKAVVLRVNSPGGSASASEEIHREVRLTMKAKPVVVSMGTVAASGGYWIAAFANRIFAEPTTITGSIGVFGLFIDVKELANGKLGLTADTVKTGRFADMMTVMRPKTPEELEVFQKLVDWIYDQFVGKVAEGRKLDKAVVQEIGQGRIWSGAEALKLGLVDEIGGLGDAVRYAAANAKLGDTYGVVEYPRHKELVESLAEAFEGKRREQTRSGPLAPVMMQVEGTLELLGRLNDPKGVYARLPFDPEIN